MIFYGQTESVSGCVMGLESLIRPFQWQMTIVPVMPTDLLDSIEAPVPMLAGITTDQYLRVREQTPPDFIQSKIWVNCTSGSVQWPYKRQHLLP